MLPHALAGLWGWSHPALHCPDPPGALLAAQHRGGLGASPAPHTWSLKRLHQRQVCRDPQGNVSHKNMPQFP